MGQYTLYGERNHLGTQEEMSSDKTLEFENLEHEVSRWPGIRLEPPVCIGFIVGNTDSPVDYLKFTPVSIR